MRKLIMHSYRSRRDEEAVCGPEADQQEVQPSADPQAPQTGGERPARDAGTQ